MTSENIPPVLLIVEDNPSSATAVESAIEILADEIAQPYSVVVVESFEKAQKHLKTGSFPDLVIVDMEILQQGKTHMPAGFYLIKQFIEASPGTEWIAMTGHRLLTSTRVGEETLADALFELPLLGIWYKDDFQDLNDLLRTFFATYSTTSATHDLDIQPRFLIPLDNDSFVTNDGKLYFRMRQAARSDANILLLGEKGTQKETIAKAIQRLSNRNHASFISLDHTALLSEEFSSGSLKPLQQMSKGTIYISGFDILDDGRRHQIIRTCSAQEGYDIRLIGGVDVNTLGAITLPLFSEEFISLPIPSLTERPSDIPILVSLFVSQYNSHAKIPKSFVTPDEIYDFLTSCHFPDNEAGVRRFVSYLTSIRPGKAIAMSDVLSAYQQLFGSFGFIEIDPKTKQVLRGGRVLPKQPTEMELKLLNFLMANEGRVCTKDEIIEAVWPSDTIREGVSDDAVSQLVKRLRDLIEFDAAIHRYIRTRRGQGYQFSQYNSRD